jgi:hypothetical protein
MEARMEMTISLEIKPQTILTTIIKILTKFSNENQGNNQRVSFESSQSLQFEL